MAKREKRDDLTVSAIDGSVVLSVRGIQIWLDPEAAGQVVGSILTAIDVIDQNNGTSHVNN